MKRQYKRVDLKKVTDFKKAEKLQNKGWKVILGGIDSILLEREVENG